jgi:RNA polymerase sigma-70 factor (ECF subfamily)
MPPDSTPRLSVVTVTSTTLLEGLKDPGNETVWLQFVERYRPLILRYGERLGLPAEDAEDATQASLLAFCQAYRDAKYERARGRLGDWLFGIVHNQVRNAQRKRGRNREVAVTETQAGALQVPDTEELERVWEEEWQDAIARECLAQVRREVQETTFQAFELFAIEGVPVAEVAERLGLTPNAVYGAKRRILRRIRELKPFMEDAW